MSEYIKPGIYINEYDKSSYITEGATTITGVVGTSPKGPANEIVFISNYADYVKVFGQDSNYLDFFARFFFKYGGNKLLIVRVTDNFKYAGLTGGIYSCYEVSETLASNDVDIPINYVEGANISFWSKSGLVKLTYLNETEYIIYNDIDLTSNGYVLKNCKRGFNSTNPLSIPTWGLNVSYSSSTNTFTTTNAHGFQNGQAIKFTQTAHGITKDTIYYVINKTSKTFQISLVHNGKTPVILTGSGTNVVQKYPIPTKYINYIAPISNGTIVSVNNKKIEVDLDYGKFSSLNYLKFINNQEIKILEEEYDEENKRSIITLETEPPNIPNIIDSRVTLIPSNFYGGFGRYIVDKFINYDEWDKAKYDENGLLIKNAGVVDPEDDFVFLNIYAKSCGAWANNDIKISLYNYYSWNSSTEVPIFKNKIDNGPTSTDEILIIVESNLTNQIEETWLVSLNPKKTDYWGKNIFITDYINNNSNYIRVFINPKYIALDNSLYNTPFDCKYLPNSFTRYYLDGGTNGKETITKDGIYISPQIREFRYINGYNLFNNKNEVDVDIISAGGNQSLAIQQTIKSIVDSRRDCIGILNIPIGMSVTDAIRYKNLIGSSSYAAIYYNGSKVLDSFSGNIVTLPPAIQVTPLIVKNDLLTETWFAPAGYNRGMLKEVIELEHQISDGEFELLYSNNINPIINDGAGPVLFGIKTMYSGSSAFNKLTIRRLLLKLEKDIKNSMKGFLFELNNFDTRLRITRTIESYLETIRTRDGIEDFRVICNEQNNTNQTKALGQIIVDIYIKPIFAAEYIIFNFTVTKDEISSIINT